MARDTRAAVGDGITRRDFLGGSALTIAAGLTPLGQLGALAADAPYPPALTGLRGSHPGAFEIAHALAREGKKFPLDNLNIDDVYDLVVAGGGIAGLSAAWLYRQRRPEAKILILDNHDDFGGHAKRNELGLDGGMRLGYGGSESMVDPAKKYATPAHQQILAALGFDMHRFLDEAVFHRQLYPKLGLSRGVFFDKETFGRDALVTGDPDQFGFDEFSGSEPNTRSFQAFLADCPLSDKSRAGLLALYDGSKDFLAGKSKDEKIAILKKTSYRDFIEKTCALPKDAADYFQGRSNDNWGLGIDAISAFDAIGDGFPGAKGLGVADSLEGEDVGPYVHHFPDGNASLARGLVRSLIPAVAPGSGMDDLVTARFDYGKLDVDGAPVRIRLSSTAVHIANTAKGVEIGYVRGSVTHRIAAKHCVVATYGMIMPYIVPELPQAQKALLALNVKAPLVYTKVLIRDWQSWKKLGIHEISAPMSYHSRLKLDYPVSLGSYRFPRSPEEPIGLHLLRVPLAPNQGLEARDQCRIGRQEIYDTTFAQFETHIRADLDRMLGPGGFDANSAIQAITVNRWPHGYSYFFNRLYDDMDASGANIEKSRARAGNIVLANSDTAWDAYAHSAIGEASRAVEELLTP